jgi:hypothetical protein
MLWTRRPLPGRRAAGPVDDAGTVASRGATLPRMTIEMPAVEVRALATTLHDQGATAQEAGLRLAAADGLRGPLAGPLSHFVEAHRVGCSAMAFELDHLGAVLHGVVDSWLGLDEVLLAARGRAPR